MAVRQAKKLQTCRSIPEWIDIHCRAIRAAHLLEPEARPLRVEWQVSIPLGGLIR